jgi:hypothetical protein
LYKPDKRSGPLKEKSKFIFQIGQPQVYLGQVEILTEMRDDSSLKEMLIRRLTTHYPKTKSNYKNERERENENAK